MIKNIEVILKKKLNNKFQNLIKVQKVIKKTYQPWMSPELVTNNIGGRIFKPPNTTNDCIW